jgi:hypothetical protein
MLIPRYWAKLEGTTTGLEGKPYLMQVWGCSAESREDATADAHRRLEAWTRRIHEGGMGDAGYGYRRTLVREPIVKEIAGADGETVGFVSRNHYGCLVLNAAGALFIDVDVPPDTIARRVWSLVRGSSNSPEAKSLAAIRAALAAYPIDGFRIYRTAAGYRVLGISRVYEPTDNATQVLMRAVGTDRAFLALCRAQKCFRARLTPKPWRIGVDRPAFTFPSDDPGDAAAVAEWVATYEPACSDWATCRFVEQVGSSSVHADVRPILQAHDAATCATSDRRLA